jgi:hypothetical protein
MDITPEKLAEEKTKYEQGPSKFFEPGNYDLKIINVEFQKMNENDPTWANFLIVIGEIGGRTQKLWVDVPTSSIYFKHDKIKNPLFPFFKFREFMSGVGIELSNESKGLTADLKKYWSDPAKTIVGKDINLDIGYSKSHIAYLGKSSTGESQFQIQKAKGEPLVPTIFTDRKEAEIEAIKNKIVIEGFVKILKIYPKIATTVEETDEW